MLWTYLKDNKERTPKEIVPARVEGTMKTGRPRVGWTDGLGEELMIMGIRKWHKVAGGIEELGRNVMEGT